MPDRRAPACVDALNLARLRAAFSAPEPPRGGEPPGVSAVLVPVLTGGAPELLLTRRAEDLSSHPGQVSFPGGRVDPRDAGPLAAALRETEEEVGIAPREVDVVGHLDDYMTYRGVLVCAYVGAVPASVVPSRPASPREVAEILRVPLGGLIEPRADGPVVAYEGRELDGGARAERVVHYWRLASGTVVWGITGELVARFLRRSFGWAPPSRPRRISHVAEFLPEAFDYDY